MESYTRPTHIPFSNLDRVHVTSGIATLNLRQRQYKKAIEFGEICFAIINNDTTTDYKETDVFETLATAYFSVGNSVKGAFSIKNFMRQRPKNLRNPPLRHYRS